MAMNDYCEAHLKSLKGLSKTTKNLSQDNGCSGLDSNRASPEQKSDSLPLKPIEVQALSNESFILTLFHILDNAKHNSSPESWGLLSPLLGDNEITLFSGSPYCVALSAHTSIGLPSLQVRDFRMCFVLVHI
jgi:hypothetical protein